MGSFHSERRQYEQLVARLRSEADELRAQASAARGEGAASEQRAAEVARKLAGAAKTRDAIGECLGDASEAIRTALAFQRQEDSAAAEGWDESEAKGKREEVLNQLLLMLNAAVEKRKAEEAATGEEARMIAHAEGEEGEGGVGYLQGSLGLVPIQ